MAPDLIPEQRTDATGRTQRRWVKRAAAASLPAPTAAPADDAPMAALRRTLARIRAAGIPVPLQPGQEHPAFTAYAGAAAHCEAIGDNRLVLALLMQPDERVVLAASEFPELVEAVAGLPVLLHEDPPKKMYRKALDRLKGVITDFYDVGSDEGFNPKEEAEFLSGALVADVLRLSLRRLTIAEAEQIRLIGRSLGLFTRNLTQLYLLREEMWPRNIHADAGDLRDLCAAMEEHGRLDLTHVAAAVAERGRLDRDEALRILLADAPALTDGIL